MIFEYLYDTDDPNSIYIHYCPGERPQYRDIYNMLRVNKLISDCTTIWLYEAHELFFNFPRDDLPLFLSRVRQNTLGRIRRVKLRHSWDQRLTLGLRLLHCCEAVCSLKISSERNFPQYYLPVLKQTRLETFEYDGPLVQKMEEIRELILGETKPKGRLLKLSREQIVGNSDPAANKANCVTAEVVRSRAIS